ncbi:hypothetical protein OAH50_00400 [bacterium]|nr:hypothetical protein [bacterium]
MDWIADPVNGSLDRLVLVGRDIELRIVSLIVRAREAAHRVIFIDTGSNDETVELAQEVDCDVYHYTGEIIAQDICTYLLKESESEGKTLILPVNTSLKLSELPLSVNRAREPWDIHFTYRDVATSDADEDSVVLSRTEIQHLILSEDGCSAMASLSPLATPKEIPDGMRARFVIADQPIQLPQRESLATASRFAQLFYWMLESKHPLLLFGIPGVVLFVLGYRLSGDLATMFTELNSTSIGVTLATVAMTLIGLFAMMVAVILYIMGKQVERIQSQYNWPKQG